MLNVADSEFGTKIYCDRPTEKHYPVHNLLKSNGCGFLCPPVIAPPVNILFCFREAVDLHLIVVKPYVRRHRVGSFSIFARRKTVKRKWGACTEHDNPFESMRHFGLATPLVSVALDKQPAETVVAVRLKDTQTVPIGSMLNTAPNVYAVQATGASSMERQKVCSVLLRINRMAHTSFSLCLGEVELWCSTPLESGCTPVLPMIPDPVSQQTPDRALDDESFQIPEDFLDPITGDLMNNPVRLPSGVRVDRTTLVRFQTERLDMQPGADPRPIDPFTMIPFDGDEVQSDVELKMAISEHLVRCKRLKDLCARLDNHSCFFIKPTISTVPQINIPSDSEPD
ncbi:u-box domain protein, partial [Opisthorchis viverrini]